MLEESRLPLAHHIHVAFKTTPIKSYVAEHNDGMKVSNLYIAQIKQKHGIIERENYNKPKSEKGGQSECPKEKEIAIEEALKYFQMIPSES